MQNSPAILDDNEGAEASQQQTRYAQQSPEILDNNEGQEASQHQTSTCSILQQS